MMSQYGCTSACPHVLGRRHSISYIYTGLNSAFISAIFNFSPTDIVTLISTHLYRLDIIHFLARQLYSVFVYVFSNYPIS